MFFHSLCQPVSTWDGQSCPHGNSLNFNRLNNLSTFYLMIPCRLHLRRYKSAGKREQNEVFFDYAKREQTRGENKSEAPAEKGPISMLKDLVFSHLKVTKKRWGVQGKSRLSKKLSKNGVFFDKRVKEN